MSGLTSHNKPKAAADLPGPERDAGRARVQVVSSGYLNLVWSGLRVWKANFCLWRKA